MKKTTYLGENVYAHHYGLDICLTMGREDNPASREQFIYLTPKVLAALNLYAKLIEKEYAAQKEVA